VSQKRSETLCMWWSCACDFFVGGFGHEPRHSDEVSGGQTSSNRQTLLKLVMSDNHRLHLDTELCVTAVYTDIMFIIRKGLRETSFKSFGISHVSTKVGVSRPNCF